jgi:hypothetical protein
MMAQLCIFSLRVDKRVRYAFKREFAHVRGNTILAAAILDAKCPFSSSGRPVNPEVKNLLYVCVGRMRGHRIGASW